VLKIAIDIDEVLADQAEAFVRFSNERWGTHLRVEDYTEHWAELWGLDIEKTLARRDELFEDRIYQTLQPIPTASEVLRHLGHRFELCVVTSRSSTLRDDTHEWLKEHYSDIFLDDSIHFSGIWDDVDHTTHTRTKADVLRKIQADYLIDDQPKHCIGAAEAGVKGVLFGDYQWSKGVDLPPLVTRCKDWQAVKEYFDALR
jgi:5'(3')-deoxyribonucleotidase